MTRFKMARHAFSKCVLQARLDKSQMPSHNRQVSGLYQTYEISHKGNLAKDLSLPLSLSLHSTRILNMKLSLLPSQNPSQHVIPIFRLKLANTVSQDPKLFLRLDRIGRVKEKRGEKKGGEGKHSVS